MKIRIKNCKLDFIPVPIDVIATADDYISNKGWHDENGSVNYSGAVTYFYALKFDGINYKEIPNGAKRITYKGFVGSSRPMLVLAADDNSVVAEIDTPYEQKTYDGEINLADYPTATRLYVNMYIKSTVDDIATLKEAAVTANYSVKIYK